MGIHHHRIQSTVDTDLMFYTLHRFAVYASGQRIPFNHSAFKLSLRESGIEFFSALVDRDEEARTTLGRVVLRNLKVEAPPTAHAPRGAVLRMRQSAR